MGLFSSVLHLYKKTQEEVINQLSAELRENYAVSDLSRIEFDNVNYKEVFVTQIVGRSGLVYPTLFTGAYDGRK